MISQNEKGWSARLVVVVLEVVEYVARAAALALSVCVRGLGACVGG